MLSLSLLSVLFEESKLEFVPFVLQKHRAIRAGLHYDFRIRYPDKKKLISFVIVGLKIPSVNDIEKKVFLIRTPDHGISWLYRDSFEIPRGEYGAGTIKTVQKGKAKVVVWTNNYIHLEINSGEYLNGNYHFFKVGKRQDKRSSEIWLLVCKSPRKE